MLKNNSFAEGLFIGLLLPVLAFSLLFFLFQEMESLGWVSTKGFTPFFRERTLGIVAIGLNALPMNLAYRRRLTNTMRGIVIPTFIFVVIWLAFFGRIILK